MFGALIGAIAPALIGGLLNRKSERQAISASNAQNEQMRGWENENFLRERAAFHGDREWDRQHEQNLYNRGQRDLEAQVASRGIDFGKLRDQAQAAGFNPLSVLGNASAYSTERGVNFGSGGGGGASFASGGRGFSAAAVPVMSSGSFIQEALERGVDTVFNQPAPPDPLADALRHAEQQGQAEAEARKRQVPGGFGYDLTQARAFSPAVVSGIPAMSRANQQVATGVLMPKGEPPDRTDTWIGGSPARKAAGWSSAADFEDEYGDVASAVYGAVRLGHDAVVNARSSKVGRAGQKKVRQFIDRATGKTVTYRGSRDALKPPKMADRDYYGRPLW